MKIQLTFCQKAKLVTLALINGAADAFLSMFDPKEVKSTESTENTNNRKGH